VRTIVFNTRKHAEDGNLLYYQVTTDTSLVHQVSNALYQLKLLSVLVEGGAQLLQSFIDEEWWDEARVISSQHSGNRLEMTGKGLPAPVLRKSNKTAEINILTDQLNIYSFAG
jgi:diaminohydroxyphosphoribosylaminopyrimidine deaminase/5-amino-6-(5-phosphoribosylamino)uracil reductase